MDILAIICNDKLFFFILTKLPSGISNFIVFGIKKSQMKADDLQNL
jgi:hypothetical protein